MTNGPSDTVLTVQTSVGTWSAGLSSFDFLINSLNERSISPSIGGIEIFHWW